MMVAKERVIMENVKTAKSGLLVSYGRSPEPYLVPWGEITVLTLSSMETPVGVFKQLVVDDETGNFIEVPDDTDGLQEVLRDLHRYLPEIPSSLIQTFEELPAVADVEVFRRADLR